MKRNLSRRIRLNKDQAAGFSTEQVLELRVDTRQTILHLLLGEDFALRIKKKSPEPKIVKNQILGITRIKNLVNPRRQKILKDIITHDRFIKGKINENIRASNQSYDEFDDGLTVLKKRWIEIAKLQKKLNLNVLRSDSLYLCENCFAFRVGRSLTARLQVSTPLPKCNICGTRLSRRKRIRCLPDSISDFLGGRWLESYISHLLEKFGWKTWTDIYVYGSSGSELEIDVLAIKNGCVLIVECKSGAVGLKDVTAFVSKFHDIKCNYALFVSLENLDQNIIKLMIRNPAFYVVNGCRLDTDILKQLRKIGV